MSVFIIPAEAAFSALMLLVGTQSVRKLFQQSLSVFLEIFSLCIHIKTGHTNFYFNYVAHTKKNYRATSLQFNYNSRKGQG